MRDARVVGLSPDGMILVVADDHGEQLAIAADERLRAAVRGDRPRLGQLENEMETSLSPRDIQSRIRSGATLEDVARVAGLPMDRVERFAAPVLAERDHVAITAMSASVRRRGETSGHRNLRVTVAERLTTRGVDIDSIEWDAYRLDDGRWAVTADQANADESQHARFLYDPRGRFSIADNDQAHWLLSERSASGPHTGDPADTEPTVDLSDELALVRATQEVEPTAVAEAPDEGTEPTVAVVRNLHRVPDPPDEAPENGDAEPEASLIEVSVTEVTVTEMRVTEVSVTGLEARDVAFEEADRGTSQPRTASRPSDASAVPETAVVGGWEPAIVVNVPLEPSPVEEGPEELTGTPASEHPGKHTALVGTDEPAPPEPIVDGPGRADEFREFELEAEVEAPPVRRPVKKKRASVPSWDEIMFGGPRPPNS